MKKKRAAHFAAFRTNFAAVSIEKGIRMPGVRPLRTSAPPEKEGRKKGGGKKGEGKGTPRRFCMCAHAKSQERNAGERGEEIAS